MVDRTETEIKSKEGFVYRWEIGEVEVSNADTFTLGNFSSSDNLLSVYVTKKDGGLEMTCTFAANNVVTITGAGTNIDCFYWAYGYPA
jgi:hypothetical protein